MCAYVSAYSCTEVLSGTLRSVIVRSGLVWFYGISTFLGYLKPNPVYTYILNINMICKHIFR